MVKYSGGETDKVFHQIEREEKADTNSGQPTIAAATNADGAADAQTKPKPVPKSGHGSPPTRSARLGLLAADESRSRSRPRHSTIIDRGQASAEIEDLEHLAPPTSGYAEVTPATTPLEKEERTIIASSASRPSSPPTIIPQSDTLSTRPTRDGIAYPFKLVVEGEGRDVNASTVTLTSLQADGVAEEEEPRPGWKENVERPAIERFVTAQEDLS